MDDSRYSLAICGLVQVLIIVLGLAVLAIIMKVHGYPDAVFFRWNPWAVQTNEHGAWLLLVPVIWCVVLCLTACSKHSDEWKGFLIGLGYMFAVFAIGLFLYLCGNPGAHAILIQVKPNVKTPSESGDLSTQTEATRPVPLQ